MDKLKVTIGIEIHLELLTKTKMFSSTPNTFGKDPNTYVNEIDMGYPGSMPTVNKQAVIFAIQLAKAMNMTIDSQLSFDRKHYYYPDLPKGYQITQQSRPIGKEGILPIENGKVIKIERIHLEEDTAKQIHKGEFTYLDFNRAGIPLIEIVTHPVIHSAEGAIQYVKTIKLLSKELGISDAKMENGSLRIDVNISLSKSNTLGTKVEIKNMNSFNNIMLAIKNEIKDQTNSINNNHEILMTTKRFDEHTKTNIVMRDKSNDIDYKYFKEPNIIPITLTKKFINSIKVSQLPWERKEQYIKEGLNDKMIEQLMSRKDLASFYHSSAFKNKLLFCKILFSTILPMANKKKCKIFELNIPLSQLEKSLTLLENQEITNSHIKILIPLLRTDSDVSQIIKKNNMIVISSENEIIILVKKILNDEPKLVETQKNNLDKLQKILLGKLMKITSGQVKIEIANKVIKQILN